MDMCTVRNNALIIKHRRKPPPKCVNPVKNLSVTLPQLYGETELCKCCRPPDRTLIFTKVSGTEISDSFGMELISIRQAINLLSVSTPDASAHSERLKGPAS